MQAFLAELKRRRVFRVAAAYAAIGFAIVSVASDFIPALDLPAVTLTVIAWTVVLGFPVALVLAWIYDITPTGLRRPDSGSAPVQRPAAAKGGAVGFIGLGMLVALVSVGTMSQFDRLPFLHAARSLPSIAVLPFLNVSGDPSNDFFSAGIHEEVMTQLYKLGGVTVISRTSVMQYAGTSKSLRAIAQELGVTTVLEASVRRVDDRVRIDARLVDPVADRTVWAESYDRDLSDVLAVQADLAQEIGRALQARLSPTALAQLAATRARAVDPAMYEIYLRGLFEMSAGRYEPAVTQLRRALELDPLHAPAYAAIARSYYSLGFFGDMAPGEAFGEMRQAARRAVELDPDLADAHATLALHALHYDWDWELADELFRRALQLSPNQAQVRHDYAHYLLAVGRIEESVEASVQAAELDPGNMMLLACAGWHGFTDHEYDDAIARSQKALMMMPGSFWPELILGWGYEHTGQHRQAIATLRSAVTSSGASPLTTASLAHALAHAGEHSTAHQLREEMFDTARERYVSAYDFAVVYAGLGDTDETFAWLRRAYAERSAMLVNIGWDPRFDGVRTDPRFRTLVTDMKLPDRPPPRPKRPGVPAVRM